VGQRLRPLLRRSQGVGDAIGNKGGWFRVNRRRLGDFSFPIHAR
jgi:hypothetical protein